MAGVQGARAGPGSRRVALPRTSDGIGVFSMGALLPEIRGARLRQRRAGRVAHLARHAGVRAARRGPRRRSSGGSSTCCCSTCRRAPSARSSSPTFLGAADRRSCSSRSRRRSRAAWSRARSPRCRKAPNRVLGYVENMSGYYCPDCGDVKPLFPESRTAIALDLPCLGPRPVRSRAGRVRLRSRRVRSPICPTPRATRALSRASLAGSSNPWSRRDEVPLRPLRQPDEDPDVDPARPRLALRHLRAAPSAATRWRC